MLEASKENQQRGLGRNVLQQMGQLFLVEF